MKIKYLFISLIAVFLLVACGATENETPTPTQETATIFTPTYTLSPSNTPITPLDPTNTPQPTNTAVPTNTPIPLPDLSGVEIISIGNLGNGLMLVTFSNVPDFDLTIFEFLVGEITFTCVELEDYPNRWYCTGESLPPGDIVAVIINHLPSEALVWEGEITVPAVPASSNPSGGGTSGGSGGSGSGGGPGGCSLIGEPTVTPWEGDSCEDRRAPAGIDCEWVGHQALTWNNSCGNFTTYVQYCEHVCPDP